GKGAGGPSATAAKEKNTASTVKNAKTPAPRKSTKSTKNPARAPAKRPAAK
ncbi:MAG: Ku protein, partial [Delftia sp.]|nr:Ku protein [Delftia sp.]